MRKTPNRYRTFDEYAEALGHSDLRLTALGRDRGGWESTRFELDGVFVRKARDGGPCLLEVAIDMDGVGLAVGVDAAGKITGNGELFRRSSVMIVPGRTGVQSSSLDTVEWLSVFIPADRLDPVPARSGRFRRVRGGFLDAPTGPAGFQSLLQRVVTAAMSGAFDDNPLGEHDAAERLVLAARAVLDPTRPGEAPTNHTGRSRISRADVLKRTYEWLEDQPRRNPSRHDLAKAAGVSDRTLHNVFLEQLGVSPKRFLRLRLLNAARRELRCANPEDTRVTDVVARLGIWDWGRFSGDYRALFGESPSATLYGPNRSRVRT